MTENSEAVRAAQRARRRALIVPREHGAWGLLLVPLFTGVAAGFAAAHRAWPLLVFIVATLSLFWLRTPLESLVGTGVVTAHTSGERWTALIASVCLGAVSVSMWRSIFNTIFFPTPNRSLSSRFARLLPCSCEEQTSSPQTQVESCWSWGTRKISYWANRRQAFLTGL
jgi:hypothetical protein